MDWLRLEIIKIALDQSKSLAQFAVAAYECESIPVESIREQMKKAGEALIEGSQKMETSFEGV